MNGRRPRPIIEETRLIAFLRELGRVRSMCFLRKGGWTIIDNLTAREKQLLLFLRELGWGEVKIRLENGQPVLIYEAIRTYRLEENEQKKINKGKKGNNRNAPRNPYT